MTMAVGVTARACDPLGSRITKTVEWDKGRRGWRVRIAMGHVTSEFGVYTTPEEASYVGDAAIGYRLASRRRIRLRGGVSSYSSKAGEDER